MVEFQPRFKKPVSMVMPMVGSPGNRKLLLVDFFLGGLVKSYHLQLVGGLKATPLKNDGLRQLGWSSKPNISGNIKLMATSPHQPAYHLQVSPLWLFNLSSVQTPSKNCLRRGFPINGLLYSQNIGWILFAPANKNHPSTISLISYIITYRHLHPHMLMAKRCSGDML